MIIHVEILEPSKIVRHAYEMAKIPDRESTDYPTWLLDRAEAAEARAVAAENDWRGLRDAVFGQENHPCENRATAELEANELRRQLADASARISELELNNSRLDDMLYVMREREREAKV